MKKKWLLIPVLGLVVTALILGGCAGVVRSADAGTALPSNIKVDLNNEQKGIYVSGTGKVTVTPDLAVLSLGVSSQAVTVAEAQSQAQQAMDKIMAALDKAGVAKKDIQTQRFSIQQVTHWEDKTNKQVVDGYMVTNIVTVKIRQLDKTGAIIDAVAVAGGDLTRINGISFTVENPSAYYTEARNKAMADAKAKAEQLASLGGVKLGKPAYISESGGYYPYPTVVPMPAYKGGEAAYDTSISPGETDINLTVQVNYAIE